MEYIVVGFLLIGVIIGLFFLIFNMDGKVLEKKYPPMKEYEMSILESKVFNSINNYRLSLGLKKLITDTYTSRQCIDQVIQSLSRGVTSHDGFPKRYMNIKNNVPANTISEIVSSGFTTTEAVVNGFKNSPKHYDTLIGDYSHMGICVKPDSNGKLYTCIINIKV